jgi:lipoprotein-anchoring transpeptidase ErfK/SrfK
MRRMTLLIGGGVVVLGAAAAVGAYAALQYQDRSKLEGIGKTRFRSERPVLRLLTTHPGNLDTLRVTVDGKDLSSFASTDDRGVVVQGASIGDGWHKVQIKASSGGIFGNTFERRFPIVIDTHRPKLALTDRQVYRTGLTLAGRTEKGATVLVRWKGGELTKKAPTGQFSIDPGLADGRYALRITARDPVGNVSRVRWQRIVLDSKPPTVDLSSVPTILEQATTELTGSVEDLTPSTLSATLDGQSIALRGPDGQQLRFAPKGATRWSVPLQNLTEGVHDLTLTAKDAAQNQVQVERHFTVDSTEKLLPGLTLTIGARGKDVAQLERRLASEGLWKGKATRFYNLRTAAAVKLYQKKHAMPQTGIANPAVIEATKGHIVVKLHLFKVFVFRDGKRIFSAPIAIGMPGHETPTGSFNVIAKIKDPTWVPPNSPWAAGLEPVPPGLSNPLGTRWIGTSAPAIGFHMTPMDYSVGHAASHGCMRMHQADVEKMYDLVDVGETVEIQA